MMILLMWKIAQKDNEDNKFNKLECKIQSHKIYIKEKCYYSN